MIFLEEKRYNYEKLKKVIGALKSKSQDNPKYLFYVVLKI